MSLRFKISLILPLINLWNESSRMSFKKKRTRDKIFRTGCENYTEKSSYQKWKMGIGKLSLRNVTSRKDLWCFTSINKERRLRRIYCFVMTCLCILWLKESIWSLELVQNKMKENESSNRWALKNLLYFQLLCFQQHPLPKF